MFKPVFTAIIHAFYWDLFSDSREASLLQNNEHSVARPPITENTNGVNEENLYPVVDVHIVAFSLSRDFCILFRYQQICWKGHGD